jgi:hypothetical protein
MDLFTFIAIIATSLPIQLYLIFVIERLRSSITVDIMITINNTINNVISLCVDAKYRQALFHTTACELVDAFVFALNRYDGLMSRIDRYFT